jgi:uncharacterized protein
MMDKKYDAALAKRLGADERGMRMYVLALLKTGTAQLPAGKERDTLFEGHMANINRLAKEGKLALAGPFEKNDKNFRGLFILIAKTIEEAKRLVETDPTIKAGVFAVELIPWYGSAALLLVNDAHAKIDRTAT